MMQRECEQNEGGYRMKKLFRTSLVSVVIVATGAVASAQDLAGTGALWAKGVGSASVSGNGAVHIEGRGISVIHVSGHERLAASGVGKRVENPDGSVTFYGWKGQVSAAGIHLAVNMSGGLIEFKAIGSGQATLQGRVLPPSLRPQCRDRGTWSDTGEWSRWSMSTERTNASVIRQKEPVRKSRTVLSFPWTPLQLPKQIRRLPHPSTPIA
jgi:hypothetical protein